MILMLTLAALICAGTVAVLRIGRAETGPIEWVGFDGRGVLVGFGLYIAAAQFWGNAFAVSVLAGLVLHEFGHVLAARLALPGGARFRLAPVLTGEPVAARHPRDDGTMFFVALMGAGFSLAPMALALVGSLALRPSGWTQSADFLLVLGTTIGAVNFVMLLPFGPMDGGICARVAARSFWPALAPGITIFMVAAMGTAGIRNGSLVLLALAAIGIYSLFSRTQTTAQPMHADHGLIALAAYAATLAAHFSAGWILIGMAV